MRVGPGTVVTLEVLISDIWGNLLEQSERPLQYLHGGHGDIFPALEAALENQAENATVEVRMEPEDAFGEYDETLLQVRERSSLPQPLELGMRFEGDPGGADHGRIYSVTDIAGDSVVLDANHPLSGVALVFRCKVLGVRAASAEELACGSADDSGSVIVRAVP